MRRLVFLLVALGLAIAAASASSTTAGTPLSPKLRSDLAALVAGEATPDAGTVSEVAGLPWVDWLAPIEVVEALTHEAEVDEARNTPADVGAHVFWDADVTGEGVRIAVLDTGLDPLHQDLDDLDFRHWMPDLAHQPLVNDPKVVD